MMASSPIEPSNQKPEQAPRKQNRGCLFRAVFIALTLVFFAVSALVGLVWVQANRPLSEPAQLKPSPAVLALLQNGAGSTSPQASTGRLPARSDPLSTSTSFRMVGLTPSTTSPLTSQTLFELIPEHELDSVELKAQARKFNESFRQWAEALRLYKGNQVKFKEALQAGPQLFGPYPQYGYYELEGQLWKTPLVEAYNRKLMDSCLQVLVYYQDWEAASDLCRQHEWLYSWDDTLYALRQIPKPLVKYPRIVVWSGLRVVTKAITKLEGPRLKKT